MDEPLMRIGELAAFYNVSTKAIRLYEKKGIITPAFTDPQTGYRYYTPSQVQMLCALLDLKALGFSLSEIKTIMSGGADDKAFLEALRRKRAAWQDSITIAESKIESIENICERISKSKDAPRIQNLTEDQRAWLLAKLVCVEDMRGQSVLSEALWL